MSSPVKLNLSLQGHFVQLLNLTWLKYSKNNFKMIHWTHLKTFGPEILNWYFSKFDNNPNFKQRFFDTIKFNRADLLKKFST